MFRRNAVPATPRPQAAKPGWPRAFALAWAGVALSAWAGAAMATSPLEAYDLKDSPLSQRGVATPISGNPDYGSVFVDEDGWYQMVMPATMTTRRDAEARHFVLVSGGNQAWLVIEKVVEDAYANGSAESLDMTTEAMIAPGSAWEPKLDTPIVNRAILSIGETRANARRPVKMAIWDTRHEQSGTAYNFTTAQIIVSHGVLRITCGSDRSFKVCHNVLQLGLRLEAGAFE